MIMMIIGRTSKQEDIEIMVWWQLKVVAKWIGCHQEILAVVVVETTSREEEIKIKVVGLLKMVADTMGCTNQGMLKILTLAVATAGKTRTRMLLVVVVVVVETIMAMWARKAGKEVGI